MTEPAKLCPACRQSVLADGRCPECGHAEPGAKDKYGPNRAVLWIIFWALFLGTPVLALAAGARGFGPLFGSGILSAGFVLSKLFTRDRTMFTIMGFVFAAGIFAIYLGIFFVGCLVMLNGHPL